MTTVLVYQIEMTVYIYHITQDTTRKGKLATLMSSKCNITQLNIDSLG